jgi:hypothetical protein
MELTRQEHMSGHPRLQHIAVGPLVHSIRVRSDMQNRGLASQLTEKVVLCLSRRRRPNFICCLAPPVSPMPTSAAWTLVQSLRRKSPKATASVIRNTAFAPLITCLMRSFRDSTVPLDTLTRKAWQLCARDRFTRRRCHPVVGPACVLQVSLRLPVARWPLGFVATSLQRLWESMSGPSERAFRIFEETECGFCSYGRDRLGCDSAELSCRMIWLRSFPGHRSLEIGPANDNFLLSPEPSREPTLIGSGEVVSALPLDHKPMKPGLDVPCFTPKPIALRTAAHSSASG